MTRATRTPATAPTMTPAHEKLLDTLAAQLVEDYIKEVEQEKERGKRHGRHR